jgi:hypothetical protein
MNRYFAIFALISTLFATSQPAQAQLGPDTEYVVCSGGPALRHWEEYRLKVDRHDLYWQNFTHAAANRMRGLREQNPNMRLTWLIYRPGYITRAQEDSKKPHLERRFRASLDQIEAPAAAVGARIVWFSTTSEFCSYLNNRSSGKMSGFEYFGHSNSMAFLFDYSNVVLGCSQCYLHSKYLNSYLRRGIFTPEAHVQSWGCNTGDHMSGIWRQATGHGLIGACKSMGGNGKTNYQPIADGGLPSVSGTWTQ